MSFSYPRLSFFSNYEILPLQFFKRQRMMINKTNKKTIIAKFPFYYGWIILGAGAVGIIASIPGQTMGVSVFTNHIIEALSITRVSFSSAYMAGTLLSALLIPYAGRLFDRFGGRVLAAASALMLALFLFMLSKSPEITAGIASAVSIKSSTVGVFVAGVSFFGMRFFGQGVLTLASRGMIVRWFDSRRGLASGILGIAISFGFSYAPRPFQALIDHYQWRGALLFLTGFLILIMVPFIIIVFRKSPESCGMAVEEGLSIHQEAGTGEPRNAAVEKTLQEAKHDIRFWLVIALLLLWGLFNTAFTFHVISIFSNIGRGTSEAVSIFFPISIVAIVVRFGASWLSDRINFSYLIAAFACAMAFYGISFFFLSSPVSILLLIVSTGLSMGLFGVMNMISWPKLFGVTHVGAISGFAMSFIVAGSALGPWLFSISYSYLGNYQVTGIGIALLSLLVMAVLLIDNRKIKRAKAVTASVSS